MSKPLVSVIMITYNHAPYLRKAIHGVLDQKTSFPFELIIGEDCSTDGSREIVFELADQYKDIIRVITDTKNVGPNENQIRTIMSCQGQYAAFCEGDDYWHCNSKLQIQTDFLISRPDVGLVYSDYDLHTVSTGKHIEQYNKYRNKIIPVKPTLVEFLRGTCGILTCTVMVRNDLLQSIQKKHETTVRSKRFLMGDTLIWGEILQQSSIAYIDKSLATHNKLTESASKSRNIQKRLLFLISGSELCLYFVKTYHLDHSELRFHENMKSELELRLAFWSKNKEQFLHIAALKKKLSVSEKIMRSSLNIPVPGYYVLIRQLLHFYYFTLVPRFRKAAL